MSTHPITRMRFMSRLGAVSLLSLSLVAATAMIPAAASPGATPNGSAGGAYVALGDSFTSGQGASAQPWGQGDLPCLRSETLSYPAIAANTSSYRAAINVACSGASAAGVVAQADSVDDRVAMKASLVTLTVGGIDAGSNGLLAFCYPDPNTIQCGEALLAVAANLDNLEFRENLAGTLAGTYSAVAAEFPKARIFVLNYPLLFQPGFSSLGDTVNGATTALNGIIAGAVAATANPRVIPVDVTQEFVGHGIGSAESFISINFADPNDARNFHPNAAGNEAYVKALRAEGALRGR